MRLSGGPAAVASLRSPCGQPAAGSLPSVGSPLANFTALRAAEHSLSPLLPTQRGDDLRLIKLQQRPHVEHEAREDFAGEAAGVFLLLHVFLVGEVEPANPFFEGEPDEVFADAIAAIGAEFVVQVHRSAAGGDFADEFRRAAEITLLVKPYFAARARGGAKNGVRLRGIVRVKKERGVGIDLQFRMIEGIGEKPSLDETVGFSVGSSANG